MASLYQLLLLLWVTVGVVVLQVGGADTGSGNSADLLIPGSPRSERQVFPGLIAFLKN